MPEFVQVGAANFVCECRSGFFALVQNVLEIKKDLRRRAGLVRVLVVRCADEKPEDSRIETVGDQFVGGKILEADRNLSCRVPQFGGEAVEGFHDNASRSLMVFHGFDSRRLARSRKRAPAGVPAGCLQRAP
jgi:hypothetical protein